MTLGKSSATVTSTTSGKTADVTKSGTLIGRDEAGTLDDNGSGVIANRTYFILVPPRGEVRRYDEEGDFIERTQSPARRSCWLIRSRVSGRLMHTLKTVLATLLLGLGPSAS
ncbi:MAG: hypothetical protein IPP40_05120 [bacterium]|nr:hypothetical protein [bacterium]